MSYESAHSPINIPRWHVSSHIDVLCLHTNMRGGGPQVVNIFAHVCQNAISFTGACARNSVPNGLGKNGLDADQLNKLLVQLIAKLHAMHMMRMCFQYVPNGDCRIYQYYHKVVNRSNSKRRRDTTPILMQLSQLCAGVVGIHEVTLNWHILCLHVGT